MSRFKLAVGAVALTVLMGLLVVMTPSSAHADEAWSPSPPVVQDRCGTKQDKYFFEEEDDTIHFTSEGAYVTEGSWVSTRGAASVVVVARNIYNDQEVNFTMAFGTEPDSSCVEEPDTVTTRIIKCDPSEYDGTLVEFTYTNTPEPGVDGWAHTDPIIFADRWDNGQSASIRMRRNPAAVWPENMEPEIVQDGDSITMTGGDWGGDSSRPDQFLLIPGTYLLSLKVKGAPVRLLPNRLFVPECGGTEPPEGDPLGGEPPGIGGTKSQPKATIGKCRSHKVRVLLDGREATKLTRYKLVVNPRKGKTVRSTYKVPAIEAKRVVLKGQKTGTVVKVVFAKKKVARKLKC